MDMDVAICYGPLDVRVERRPVRVPGPESVLVRIAYCGVCPWDLRVFSGLSSSVRYPLQFGHEISGVVEAAGSAVSSVQPGDRVVVNAVLRCGTCPACRRGLENHCERPDYSQGGFAQYIVAHATNVYPLRPTTCLTAATLTEPLACIVHAQNRAAAEPGQVALVLGCGPLGLLHAQLLRQRGARVIVSDPIPGRLELARSLGVELALNPTNVDLAESLARETEGWGADVVIVATGVAAAAQQATGLLARNGRLILFAGVHPNAELVLDCNLIHYREIWITGSSEYTRAEFRQSLSLIEDGTVVVEPLISDVFALDQIDLALATLKTASRAKILVRCNDL